MLKIVCGFKSVHKRATYLGAMPHIRAPHLKLDNNQEIKHVQQFKQFHEGPFTHLVIKLVKYQIRKPMKGNNVSEQDKSKSMRSPIK